MTTIHKYAIALAATQGVAMPAGSYLLTVQVQRGQAVLWAKVDPDRPMATRLLHVRGTGQPVDDTWPWIATYQDPERGLVWHVFDGGWE